MMAARIVMWTAVLEGSETSPPQGGCCPLFGPAARGSTSAEAGTVCEALSPERELITATASSERTIGDRPPVEARFSSEATVCRGQLMSASGRGNAGLHDRAHFAAFLS